MKKTIKNLPASVRERLLQRARKENRPFNELLQYFAIERLLYRFSRSTHKRKFILKGALMLRAWQSPEFRATQDIDMLGKVKNDEENILNIFKDVMITEVEPDGMEFQPDTLVSERITEDADYSGIRLRFGSLLGTARVNLQIDIGFGDIIIPGPEETEMPVMLDFPAPKLLSYTRESAIAEKFEAMVSLAEANSRMKDFYDIWLLSRQFNFNGQILTKAIQETFRQRETKINLEIVAFSDVFVKSKQIQWLAFQRRLGQDHVPKDFSEIVKQVENFLFPVVDKIVIEEKIIGNWNAPEGWVF